MSTHNICIRGEIRKILCGYPLLSLAMLQHDSINFRILSIVFVLYSSGVFWFLALLDLVV